jgi:hypothetical protein
LIPIGIQWGNDPLMDQAAVEAGAEPRETWLNPDAEVLRRKLGGRRPSWGWNGRLNGPGGYWLSRSAYSSILLGSRVEMSVG